MFTWLQKLVITAFLKKELEALKTRLADASAALDNVEKAAVGLAKDASADAQALGEKVLSEVLTSADKIRAKADGFVHEWEPKLYAEYQTAKGDVESVYQKAQALAEKTILFFKSKL